MKQQGRCIVGDLRVVDSYTSDWMSIKMHPATFYRRQADIQASLEKIRGLYAELDMGQYILLRFSEKDDVTTFHRHHHEYI
jgi:hypothetical protein